MMLDKLKKILEDVGAMCPSTTSMMGEMPNPAIAHVSCTTEEEDKDPKKQKEVVSEGTLLRRAQTDRGENNYEEQMARMFCNLGMTVDDLNFTMNRRNISPSELYKLIIKLDKLGIDYKGLLNEFNQ